MSVRCVSASWSVPQKGGRRFVRFADGSGTTYARLVAEVKVRRPLRDGEVVHHLNGDPSDDRFENLEVLASASVHNDRHRPPTCTECGIAVSSSTRTYGCQVCKARHLRWKKAGKPYTPPTCGGCGVTFERLTPGCRQCAHRHGERKRVAA